MSDYKIIKIHIGNINPDNTTIERLSFLYPKEDISFELTNNELVINLRQLDFLDFRNNIQTLAKNSHGETSRLLDAIFNNIEKIKSYGLRKNVKQNGGNYENKTRL